MKPFDYKHPSLIVRTTKPFNAGPPLPLLYRNFITPTDLFFVRNHADVPMVDEARYRLSVGGMVDAPLQLTLQDIKKSFSNSTVPATLQCAGNRRDEMARVREIPGELPWGAEAISNAAWTGAPLREILLAAKPEAAAAHVAFTGLDEVERRGETFGFGGSIPIEKALNAEVLLAYEMNDEPLTPTHGFPLRAIVPGYIGARSVKWLSHITLQAEPSRNYFQARAYKLFPPYVDAGTVDWNGGIMLGEQSLNSVICTPQDGEAISAGHTRIKGYAMAGGDRRIERVDVSIDGGETWTTAALPEDRPAWVWSLWEAALDLPPGEHEIIARAWDSAANTQPEHARHLWNFKGYMNNSWHRVRVRCGV
ncbi:MAG: molybdopterin-dependent oxidoreductase [Pyrinomonadaceae bacterium]